MKKSILMGLGAIGLAAMGGFAPSASNVQSGQTQVQSSTGGQQAKEQTPQPGTETATPQKEQVKNRFRPTGMRYVDRGTSPKEWGQYLQASGRQKWTKSQRV